MPMSVKARSTKLAKPVQNKTTKPGEERTAMAAAAPLGAAVRKLRAKKQISQVQLAEASGVCPNTVRNCERGRALLPQTFEQIAKALGTTGATIRRRAARAAA